MARLFTRDFASPKLAHKAAGHDVEAVVLYLAPGNLSGHEVCAARSVGCTAGCLNMAGRGGIGGPDNQIQRARVRRTRQFHADRAAFLAQIVREIQALEKHAAKRDAVPAVRLNGTSDIAWERVPVTVAGVTHVNLMALFPNVRFYDYTKLPGRANLPTNYHVTFSLSEDNDRTALKAVARSQNVAVVMGVRKGRPLPATWGGLPVIDGDAHDFRFLDPRGCVVGLRAKGPAIGDGSGFVRDAAGGFDASRVPVYAAALERRAA